MSDEYSRDFDCIRFVREVRAKIAKETEGMSNAERVAYYRNYPIKDPALREAVAEARKDRLSQADQKT